LRRQAAARRERTAESPGGLALRGFSAFEKERFESQQRADVQLEVAERVIRQLEQARPPALLSPAGRHHPPAQLDLPAGDGEQSRVLLVAFAAPPAHLLRVELSGDVERDIGGGSEDLLQAPGPLVMKPDNAFVVGAAHGPAGTA